MTCKLCLQPKKLQNSHVVPEFFYKSLYDVKHRIYVRRGGKLTKTSPLQKGFRERLLCWECEQKLSHYERYNREILYGGIEIKGFQKKLRIEFVDLNYQRVRVFYLSLLWRMSIASHQFWKEVNLGPHEETVRKMVLEEDPGDPHYYGVVCIMPLFDGQFLTDLVLQPDFKRSQSGRFYRVVLGGFLFLFYVWAVKPEKSNEPLFIQKNGSWTILVKDARKTEFLREEAKRVAAGMNK